MVVSAARRYMQWNDQTARRMKPKGAVLRSVIRVAVFCALAWVPFNVSDARASEGQAAKTARPFNDVLSDLLDEFAYDIKTSQVPLVATVSVRKVSLSESVPLSYEKYLETMISERVRQFSQSKVIHCTTCRVKQSIVKEGRVHVTSPINNKRALDQLAREYGIEAWIDIGLVYQEESLVMALNLFDSRTKVLLWSKIYNSEDLYRRFPSGVPDPETDRDELPEEPSEPEGVYIFGAALGWALVPNLNEPTSMLAIPVRFAEVFNKKRSEAGAQAVILVDTDALLGRASPSVTVDIESSDQVVKPDKTKILNSFQYGLGLFGTYHHNFKTSDEDLDSIRPGIQFGVGIVAAENYLSFTAKGGFSLRLGHRLFLDAEALYSAPTTIEIGEGYKYKTQGGFGALASFGIHL